MDDPNINDQLLTVPKLAEELASDPSFVYEIGLDEFSHSEIVQRLTFVIGFVFAMYNTAKSIFKSDIYPTLDDKFIELIYSRIRLMPEIIQSTAQPRDYAKECYRTAKRTIYESGSNWDAMTLYEQFFEICVCVFIEEMKLDRPDLHLLMPEFEEVSSRSIMTTVFQAVFSRINWELDDRVKSTQVSQVETRPPDTSTTKTKKTWLATVLCLFFGPLGMFYFGWRPAIAALVLFGTVSISFRTYAEAATEVTETPPWVLPSVIFLWAYVGWRHAKGWNAQVQDGKSNYFNSFSSGVLSTLYLIWLNILISLPVLSIFALVDGYMNSQLQTAIMFASLRLFVAFVWFWAGRFHIFPWCERTFGRLRQQQVSQNEKVILSPKKAPCPDSRLKEYPLLYLYFDDFPEIARAWSKSNFEAARHDSDIRSCHFSLDEIMADENLFLDLYKNKLLHLKLLDGTELRRDSEENYWDRIVNPEKYADELSFRPDSDPQLVAMMKETRKKIDAEVEVIRLRYGLTNSDKA